MISFEASAIIVGIHARRSRCAITAKRLNRAPRKPSSPMVTLMCMKSLRRLSLGLMARNPNNAQRQAEPCGNERRWMTDCPCK